MSTYPRRPKAEALVNVVDVVERLHDPTDSSTDHMAPLCLAHIQLDDVPRTLDPTKCRGTVSSARRHGDGDGDVNRAGLRLSTTTI